MSGTAVAQAQESGDQSGDQPQAPDQVDVQPVAQDEQIAARLEQILRSTGWFTNVTVAVREGVVFLDGRTTQQEYHDWAGNLARNTQDVVAVVNRIQVIEPLTWDLTPALTELSMVWRGFLRRLPIFGFVVVVLIVAWVASRYTALLARWMLRRRLTSPILRNVAAAALSVPVFLLGLYIALQISGLTRLALTVLGGTGLAGLIVGIAFRDILENFLASVLISTRKPFLSGDRIEVAGYMGIVQQVTTRGTVLMTLEGNHVQIPNATIYRSNLVNYTANPNLRLEFDVGVGYDNDLADVQDRILRVLVSHPAILADPEPLALVDSLGAATVNLRVLFWINGKEHSLLKVRSAAIRLVKGTLEEAGISLPDEAREIIFPQGVPLVRTEQVEKVEPNGHRPDAHREERAPAAPGPAATAAEGDLSSEDAQIREQARQSRSPEEGADLLESNGSSSINSNSDI